jgi:hypothetical protein
MRTKRAITAALFSIWVGLSSAGAAPAVSGAADCGTSSGRGCAPDRERVDLAPPVFSNPTEITNPLFPISGLDSVVLLGHVDGKPFRTETTLLPGNRTVLWNGQRIDVLVSQYVAFLDGEIDEVALDRYAQADDGSVWYFGEDVFDYRKGTIAITEGTWLAGRDGPPAMIMPAKPNVGDVYRTENIPGVVFEEVTVASVGESVSGPSGRVPGAMVARELHSDATTEDKTFAPGYGEFRTASGGDLEALALAVPTDASARPEPTELPTLLTAAGAVLESARLRDWNAALTGYERASSAWQAMRADQPPMIAARLDKALASLEQSLKARDAASVSQAAIDLKQSALDLALRYRAVSEVDAARFDLWTQQLRVDAAAGHNGRVAGAVAALEWTRDRLTETVTPAQLDELDGGLRDVRIASDAGNLSAAADHAARLAVRVRGFVSG